LVLSSNMLQLNIANNAENTKIFLRSLCVIYTPFLITRTRPTVWLNGSGGGTGETPSQLSRISGKPRLRASGGAAVRRSRC